MTYPADKWQRIQDLFHEAVELPATERDSFLNEQCGGDLEMWREVASLINADKTEGDTISSAVAGAVRVPAPSHLDARVGPYRLLQELGHGGMGSVYLAEREGADFQQRVAIKLLHGLSGADRAARFRAERRILAGLEHPNIARLLDGGATHDGSPYLVMEYVAGLPIDVYCQNHQLSIEARLRLFSQVCDAVDHAHVSLVVHRDIKPSNILVTADGAPKLLDFGIAKLIDREAQTGDEAPVTSKFVRLFTRDYASPEQIRGEAITTATDTYALGVLLYELLAGARPYQFASQRLEDIERVIATTDPRPPSAVVRAGDTRLARQMSGDLDTIVMTAMDKDPRRRYASAGRLAEDVRRFLDKRPIMARPTTWTYRAGRFMTRHRLAVSAAALVVAGVVGAAVLYALQAQRVQHERDTAEQLVAFMTELFSVADPSESRGNSITAREILDRGAARIETKLTAQPEVQAAMLDTMGGVYRSLGLYERSQSLLERAVNVRAAIGGRRTLETAASLARLAETLRDRSKLAEAEPLAREALEIRRALAGPRHRLVAQSLNNLGLILNSRGRPDEALPLFEQALAIWGEQVGPASAEAAQAYNNIALVYRDRQDFKNGFPAARESLRIRRAVLGDDHPQTAASVTILGQMLDAQGDDAEAEVLLREAKEMREKIYGADHPMATQAANNLASVIHDQGRFAEAEPLYRLAMEKNRARLGDHQDTAMNMNNLASLLEEWGRGDEAARYYRESLEMRRRVFGPEHPAVGRAYNNSARFLLSIGRSAEALPMIDESIRIKLLTLKPDHVDVVTSVANRAGILADLGRRQEAEQAFRDAIDGFRKNFPAGHITITGALAGYARLLYGSGRSEAALPLAEEAVAIRATALPESHWMRAQSNVLLGAIRASLGRQDEGVRMMTSALQTMRTSLRPDDRRVVEAEAVLARYVSR